MATTTKEEKLDLAKLRPDSFKAGRAPALVTLEPAYYLTLNGIGNPNGPATDFTVAIGALYSVAFPLKMLYKARGMDYKMPPMEALWWAHGNFGTEPRDITNPSENWRWRLLIMVPDYVDQADLEQVKQAQFAKKGIEAIQRVELELVEEGLCVQVMYFGPYAEETQSINEMRRFMNEAGLKACGAHHEIYFNDPSRTAPEKLRTLIRQPVRLLESDCEGPVGDW